MIDVKDLIPEIEAREVYNNIEFMDELNDDEQRLVLQSMYYYDKELFAHDICARWVRDQATGEEIATPQHHREIWKEDEQKRDMLVIIARDHAKSTAECKIETLHELIYKTEKAILILSEKVLGEKIIGDIKKELETNDTIRWLYGSLIPTDDKRNSKSEKWRQRYLQLLNGCEVQSLSKGEPFRGNRPTRIKVDDPQSKKDVKNPLIAEEFWIWFWTEVYPMLDDGGSVIVLGTIISNNCFVNKLKSTAEEKDFKVIEYPAILNFDPKKVRAGKRNDKPWYYFDEGIGTPLWPEKWPIEALERRYNKIGHKAFLQEYQNIPFVTNGQPVFDPEYVFKVVDPVEIDGDLKYFTVLTEPLPDGSIKKLYRAIIGIDLASGVIGGDYSTITARTPEGRLLCQFRGYITQDRLCEIVDKIVDRLVDCLIIPENNMALAFLAATKSYKWYRKIFRQKTMDKVTNKESEILGFNTNAKTKPLIINRLDQKFRAGDYEVSAEELEEIQHYYHDERGGMNAIAPYHDDLIISDALVAEGSKRGFNAPSLSFF